MAAEKVDTTATETADVKEPRKQTSVLLTGNLVKDTEDLKFALQFTKDSDLFRYAIERLLEQEAGKLAKYREFIGS